jgi:hypothetical protein
VYLFSRHENKIQYKDKKKMYKYLKKIYTSAKSIGKCKKNPYIINQNHILSKKYGEVISG